MGEPDALRSFGSFDFGLSSLDERRARDLHHDAIIVDTLSWGPVSPLAFDEQLTDDLFEVWETTRSPLATFMAGLCAPARRFIDGTFPDYRDLWRDSGITAATRTIEVGDPETALRAFAEVQFECDGIPWMSKALSSDDIRRAKSRHEHCLLINTQLVTGPGDDLVAALATYHAMGLRMLMLTYNEQNVLGSGCTAPTDSGLTAYGVRVVEEMNRLGIIVDTSHCSTRTTLDACAASSKPVVASHAPAQAVYPHARAKSDDVLRAIAATGGTIGVVAVPFFLAEDRATVENVLDHVDHIAKVVGPHHVTIGTDWPNALPPSMLQLALGAMVESTFRPEDGFDLSRETDGFIDRRDLPNITRGLVARGYSDDEIRGILGANFLRVFDAVQS